MKRLLLIAVLASVGSAAAAAENATLRLVSPQKQERLRRMLPEVDDAETQQLLADERLLFFTDDEIPPAYQLWSGQLPGVHDVHYNVSANRREPFGNGNREFPWMGPGGTHRTRNVYSFRFLWLPLNEDGKPIPIVWYKKYLRGDSAKGYGWTFPVGAVLGEVLMQRGPDGFDHTFELRLRRREFADWGVDVFRPFPTAGDLANRIKELRPDWETRESLCALVKHLESPAPLPVKLLADKQPGQTVFRQAMGVDVLPALGDDLLTAELLAKTPFRSCLAAVWKEDANGAKTFAPTTKAAFHIVPAFYDGGFIEVERSSCLRCHETVNQPVDRFDFGRDWYGRIRGSDGIFSFHPFEPWSISWNGFGRARVSMRSEFIEAGLLEAFDRKRHTHDVYQQVEGLVE